MGEEDLVQGADHQRLKRRDAPRNSLIVGIVLGAAMMAVALAMRGDGSVLQWIAAVPLGGALGYLAVFDGYTHKLPNRLQYPTLGVLIVIVLVAGILRENVAQAFMWGLGTGAVFLLLALVGGGLGMGDVKLAIIIGLWTGWLGSYAPVIWLVSAFLLGGFVAVILLLARRANATDMIAFGPYLIIGAFAATWWKPI